MTSSACRGPAQPACRRHGCRSGCGPGWSRNAVRGSSEHHEFGFSDAPNLMPTGVRNKRIFLRQYLKKVHIFGRGPSEILHAEVPAFCTSEIILSCGGGGGIRTAARGGGTARSHRIGGVTPGQAAGGVSW